MMLVTLSHWMLSKEKHESSILLLIIFWTTLTFHELEIWLSGDRRHLYLLARIAEKVISLLMAMKVIGASSLRTKMANGCLRLIILFFSKNLTAWHGGDALVLAVAAQNNNTIVIVNSVGPVIIEPWIDHPNVTAVRILSTSLFVCIF